MRQTLFARRMHCGWHHKSSEEAGFMGGHFGVRRPLRHLAYRLKLNEEQVTKLAEILDTLKTERAQAEVDQRRSLSAFAEAMATGDFADAKAQEAAEGRVRTAENLSRAVAQGLREMHALLDKEQREKLAYMIRTGELLV